jgi:hypothetical protein
VLAKTASNPASTLRAIAVAAALLAVVLGGTSGVLRVGVSNGPAALVAPITTH